MAKDDDFEPRLGRMRAAGKGRRARSFLSRAIAAANLARGGAGGPATKRGFTGSRIGRGAGTGRMLASRDRYAAFRQRRVIVKVRTVRLGGKGFDGAKAHLRYVQREGTTRDGGRGQLYGAAEDQIDRNAWLEQGREDRHQFRIIVSPEDGAHYDDLRPLTRRLMTRVEEDLGTRLDWVAIDHYNTGHPHTHIIVRGKDERGQDLIIARDYVKSGVRERACELVELDLGPRTDAAIERRLRAEMVQERLTSIDRALIHDHEAAGAVSAGGRGAIDRTLRLGRLRTLERLGLATALGDDQWRLAPGLADTLRRLGERGDIIRTMQRAYAGRLGAPARADQHIYDPAAPGAGPLIGCIYERGLSDEHGDRHYLIVEATDGRSHYVEIGLGETVPAQPVGAIVRLTPRDTGIRVADLTIIEVAAANDGLYTIDAHLSYDAAATQSFAVTHERRLEAMRRLSRNVERLPDGSWRIEADHYARVAAYEAAKAKDRPVNIEILSPQPLEKLVEADAATWLDRELVAPAPAPLRDSGFGHAVREAQTLRRQWLIGQDLAMLSERDAIYQPDLIATLQRRELLRVAGQFSGELGLPFAEAKAGERIAGQLARPVELMSGRYALIERARDFTLVPWRPVLERHIGKPIAGIMRENGISWEIGRQRSGPSLS